ncbi:MAG TPA: sensor histidine kinase KdpD [Caulobacteraceae bacterium]|nr:sensor histidine kinase KdpD [Caulobacteraceae bacterium]
MAADEPRRPDPDALLLEAAKERRGRLKVFLGMAPGVGKTYEMLSQAARRHAEGGEVLVGIVETHGRRETEALLAGLEVLPRRPIEYKGRSLLEFDIDAALARKPALLLIDEYAHSNAPGSRHPKRWQDVEELLGAGINVWTTLNVQHLESLVDVVWKITGVRQRETVPDSALSRADDIELVDITPDELRQRLAEGKVYLPETARLASTNYFKPENLTALRELALRRMAQTVDDQLVTAMRQRGVEGPWAAGERILVLIGPDPAAESLVRAGRRLSEMMMDAPWTVAYVERPNAPSPDAAHAARVSAAFKLAEQLGGANVVLTGDDLVNTVLEYAHRNNVTQIVVAKSRRARWKALFGRALVPALVENVRGAALHVITEQPGPDGPAFIKRIIPRPEFAGWRDHLAALASVAAAGGVSALLDRSLQGANLAMIFLMAVLLSALAFGLGPALTAAAVSALVYNFFFLEPRLSFRIGHAADLITFLVFFAAAMIAGWLAGRVRDQALAMSRRATAVTALLAASRRLSASPRKEETAQALADQLAAAAGGAAIVLLPKGDDVVPVAGSPALKTLNPADLTAARWAWEHGEAAGADTGTLPSAGWTFRPLQGLRSRSGVAGVEARTSTGADSDRFVSALLDQGAVALERAEFAAEAADAEALRRTDRLRSALLNSVSHDLRTPLATVLGSATTLLEYSDSLEKPVQVDLLASIREEAERLNRYVGNLLDMTRLEGGGLEIRSDWIDVRDVIAAAVERITRRLGDRKLSRDFPSDLPMVKADPTLLEQAIVNILENAIAYSPDNSTIELAGYEDRNNVVLSIEDEGRGIPTAELERVFEKFRRMEEASDRGKGAGLGLAISKGFIEAMGGRIAAASPIRNGCGTRILVSLKKEAVAKAPAREHA